MLALRYSLGTLHGVPVEAHTSLLLIVGVLALRQPHLGASVATFVLLAGAVFLHEAAHAMAGRWRGHVPRKIALHAFGGLSALEAPPSGATDDVLATLAGPLCTLAVGAAEVALGTWLLPGWIGEVSRSAGFTTLYWGAFNLLPAVPMDGGRLLRRALASCRGGLVQATLATLRTSQVVISLVGVYGLFARGPAWVVLAIYLYMLSTIAAPELLREARNASDTATVSPPPYARSRPRRVDVTKVD
jgi:Zn-dependent protease